MTPLQTIKRLAELQKDATKGKWFAEQTNSDPRITDVICFRGGDEGWSKLTLYTCDEIPVNHHENNAALIAQSGSTDFAALAEYVEGLRAAVKGLADELKGYYADAGDKPYVIEEFADTIAKCED